MSATELSLSRILADELERLGIKTVVEASFPLVTGSRIQTDIYLEGFHAGIEGKLGDHGKLVKAMGQLWNLRKAGLRGGFIVLFDPELKRGLADLRSHAIKAKNEVYVFLRDGATSLKYEGGLSEIASWIKTQLEKPTLEVDISGTIDVLRRAVSYLADSLKDSSGRVFEDIFGGKSVFENILQYGEGEYPSQSMMSAAAYLLANQILFYYSLSTSDPEKFPMIKEEDLKHPTDLRKYLDNALKVDYQAVFSFDIASRLPIRVTEQLRTIIEAIKLLGPEKIRHDFLGQVFHDMIPLQVRKPVAAYYTNIYVAELLASIAIRGADDAVMDMAVGSGGLLVASYRAKKRLVRTQFSENQHKTFVEQQLTGIDIMPFAAHLATVNLSLQAPLYQTNKVRIAVWDSTELETGQEIPPVARAIKEAYRMPTLDTFFEGKTSKLPEEAFIGKGAYALQGETKEKIPLTKVDVVIMNPPFTRQERIPKDYKSKLDQRFRNYESYVHGQLGYYGYFVLLADKFLKEKGRMALVLPATVLRAQSCEGIRRLITERYSVEFIITTWSRSAFSESARFREILLIAEKQSSSISTTPCLVVVIKSLPGGFSSAMEIAQELLKFRAAPPHGTVDTGKIIVSSVSQEKLRKNVDNLFGLIAVKDLSLNDVWSAFLNKARQKLVAFKDFLESQKTSYLRGTEMTFRGMKAESVTIMSNEKRAIKATDVWLLSRVEGNYLIARHRFLNTEVKVPIRALTPALRRVALVDQLDITDNSDFVITSNFGGLENFLEGKVNKRTKSILKLWKNYVESRLCNLVIVRRPDLSASGTHFLAFYSSRDLSPSKMAWAIKLNEHHAIALALWFNSTIHLLQLLLQRIETRGSLIECSGYIMENLLVVNPMALGEVELDTLTSIYKKFDKTTFPSLLEQLRTSFAPRRELDKAILHVLGYSEQEAETLLCRLYGGLTQEIELLKEMMVERPPKEENNPRS